MPSVVVERSPQKPESVCKIPKGIECLWVRSERRCINMESSVIKRYVINIAILVLFVRAYPMGILCVIVACLLTVSTVPPSLLIVCFVSHMLSRTRTTGASL